MELGSEDTDNENYWKPLILSHGSFKINITSKVLPAVQEYSM